MLSSTRPRRSRRVAAATAGIASLALLLGACSGDTEEPGTTDGDDGEMTDEEITLTVATFNNFGYTDELLAQYSEEHPNVTIEHVTAAESGDARTNLTTKLAAGGEGLADIEAIEVDWLPELMQYPDLFADLPTIDGRWVDWKVQQATTPDGKLIGYGTDIGPEAICYRSDLLEAAGLPSEREEVAEWIGGDDATWDTYFAAGKEYVDETGNAWFDSAQATFQGMVNQLDAAYEDPATGEPKDLASNTEVKGLYDQVLAAAAEDELSAGLEQWGDDWAAGFQNDAFATMLCPAWMTGPIEQNAGNVEGWDIADVFPGGGGNWGGSFLTVPASGANTEAATELADWLTSPEVQTQAFEEAGTFPSQIEAQESEAVQTFTNDFMSGAPAGEIFSTRAQAIDGAPFKGANYFAIHAEVQNAINRVDLNGEDPETSWETAVTDAANVIQ
ncbi:cellobiose-binding protein [Isoptericola sp. CG 20/1183]|uniref:Cellobiose-binding protein n=1 Tax=Isoptericola halotolerans TaxID=300560 RepID=A0ABX5EGA1_9MICO|nr:MULTISPECIES: ABC transporter substrate-binding protein [Isoptericola]PRZ06505.1 cellobiose-binding protein [Isoptericola halotolerans]PRZ06689.1 cellobiose-binding protein [Isoptericola sp. CG 20/1183]